jgi:hypothetical protein
MGAGDQRMARRACHVLVVVEQLGGAMGYALPTSRVCVCYAGLPFVVVGTGPFGRCCGIR